MSPIRLLIVDDHEIVRIGLKALFFDYDDIAVVAEACDAEEALQQVAQQRPDVAVVDVKLPDRSGLDLCGDISRDHSNTKVVIHTAVVSEAFVSEALRVGASGFVLKEIGSDELVRAVRAAARGESAFDPKTAKAVVDRFRRLEDLTESSVFKHLSGRELDVLRLIATGLGNKAIAANLGLQEVTVRNYVSNILVKIGVESRTQLAIFAVEHRLLDSLKQS